MREVYCLSFLRCMISGLLGSNRPALRRVSSRTMASLWERETSSLNLGRGHPKPSLLNGEPIFEALRNFESKEGSAKMLQYGAGRGPSEMCDAAVEWMRKWGRTKGLSTKRIMATSGASSALGLVCDAFTKPGDVVIVEKPAYFLAYKVFLDHGLSIVEVNTDEYGLDMTALASELESGTRPTLLYTVPMCNNPKGTSLSAERAARLVDLSRKYDFKIASDEVYFFLQFQPKLARSLAEEDDESHPTVICMHSMSKTLGPGTRVGWIDAHPTLIERLLSSGVIVSGGCTSHFMACGVAELISSGQAETLLASFRDSYLAGAEALTSALDEFLPGALSGHPYHFIKPTGGYFVWLELPPFVNTRDLVQIAEERHGVFFFAGPAFAADGNSFLNCLRLCFTLLEPEDLREGVRRLSNAVKEYMALHPGTESS